MILLYLDNFCVLTNLVNKICCHFERKHLKSCIVVCIVTNIKFPHAISCSFRHHNNNGGCHILYNVHVLLIIVHLSLKVLELWYGYS